MADFYIQYPDKSTKLVGSTTNDHKAILHVSSEEWQQQVQKNTKRYKSKAEEILS